MVSGKKEKTKVVEKMICTANALAVFRDCNTASGRVGQISRGDVVVILARRDGWVKIERPAGWAPAGHLKSV